MKTAVEFLENQYHFNKQLSARDFKEAKEMEKEYIVNAHYQGYRSSIGTTEISEQYFNETFKSE
jgi:hypothetical protein